MGLLKAGSKTFVLAVSALSVAVGAVAVLAGPILLASLSTVTLALAFGIAGFALGLAGLAAAAHHRKEARDMRAAFRIVTAKIARLEARIGAVENRAEPIAVPPAPAPDVGEIARGVIAPLKTDIAELTAEIGLIGGLMRELAETVSAHDRAIDDVRSTQRAAAKPESVAPVAPVASVAMSRPVGAAPAQAWPARARIPEAAPAPAVTLPEPIPRDDRRADLYADAALDDRAEIHLQPVMKLPQRRVAMYEVLTRLRLSEAELVPPAEFLPVVERRGLAPIFDERVLRRVCQVARHLVTRGSETLIAMNVSPHSLGAPGFIRAAARILEEHRDVAARIVLECPQRAIRQLDAERLGALADLVDMGIGLSIDHVTDFRLDPASLADRGVRFVKIPAAMLLSADPRHSDIAVSDLVALLARAGINLVAERVEHEEAVRDLLDLNVAYGQGFVFAVPRPIRPEVLAPPPAGAHEAEAPLDAGQAEAAPAPPPERKPFRAFLRRTASA